MMGSPACANRVEQVLLPQAIPPVSPISRIFATLYANE